MPDRTDRTSGRLPGPWPDVLDETRIFDQGAAWCVNAGGHPGFDVDYPDPIRHVPPYECRGPGLFVDAVDGLIGVACDLEVYAARPFQFGELRSVTGRAETRIAFDVYGPANDATGRFSVSLGDALRVAMRLLFLTQSIDGPVRSTG